MRISDWSSDVCSSDLAQHIAVARIADEGEDALIATGRLADFRCCFGKVGAGGTIDAASADLLGVADGDEISWIGRSEEHTSELQSLMRISYAVFCLKKKNQT